MKPMSIEDWDAQVTTIAQSGMAAIGTEGRASANAQGITNKLATQEAVVRYADEIPPFDITVSFANEYGQKAYLVIYGVEILNEGTRFSIDNVSTEKACTFVARKVDYMRSISDGSAIVNEGGTSSN